MTIIASLNYHLRTTRGLAAKYKLAVPQNGVVKLPLCKYGHNDVCSVNTVLNILQKRDVPLYPFDQGSTASGDSCIWAAIASTVLNGENDITWDKTLRVLKSVDQTLADAAIMSSGGTTLAHLISMRFDKVHIEIITTSTFSGLLSENRIETARAVAAKKKIITIVTHRGHAYSTITSYSRRTTIQDCHCQPCIERKQY